MLTTPHPLLVLYTPGVISPQKAIRRDGARALGAGHRKGLGPSMLGRKEKMQRGQEILGRTWRVLCLFPSPLPTPRRPRLVSALEGDKGTCCPPGTRHARSKPQRCCLRSPSCRHCWSSPGSRELLEMRPSPTGKVGAPRTLPASLRPAPLFPGDGPGTGMSRLHQAVPLETT